MDPEEIERAMKRTRAAIGADLDAIARQTRSARAQAWEQSLRAVPVVCMATGAMLLARWWRSRRRARAAWLRAVMRAQSEIDLGRRARRA